MSDTPYLSEIIAKAKIRAITEALSMARTYQGRSFVYTQDLRNLQQKYRREV